MIKYRIARAATYPYEGYLWEYAEEWRAVACVSMDETGTSYVIYMYHELNGSPQPEEVYLVYRNGQQIWPVKR